MPKFIVNFKSEEYTEGLFTIRISKLGFVETPHGRVVAYHSDIRRDDVTYPTRTHVPGFYQKELGRENDLRVIEREPVPSEQQDAVSGILREKGYQGNINFW